MDPPQRILRTGVQVSGKDLPKDGDSVANIN